MDNKVMAIAAVAIIVVAAIAVVAFALPGKDNKSNSDPNEGFGTDTVVIYGNANNDSYINSDDKDMVQDIVDKKSTWDRSKNPFADANCDGQITKEDVDKIQMIMDPDLATRGKLNTDSGA